MIIKQDNGLSDLLASHQEEKLCTGFGFTEGPIWIAEDECLLFTDIPGDRILRWRPGQGEVEVYREPSGHANGLTLDHEGSLLACEQGGRRVSRARYGGTAQTVVDRYEGGRFHSPNDIVVHSSGAIYFTDPDFGITDEGVGDFGAPHELDHKGVYRYDPDGTLTLLIDEFVGPNGLAFSPDESVLYVNDFHQLFINRYDVLADGSLANGRRFVDMPVPDRDDGPDGMKVDEDGRLWTTGVGGVWVLDPDGTLLGIFDIEEIAANLNWRGPDFSTLYLTAETSVYSVETNVRGIAPGSR